MADDRNWFQTTFSSTSSDEDIVKSRSLNITRITGLMVPVLGGISAALNEYTSVPPFDDVGFQRQLVLVLVAFLAVVVVADIIGRSLAASRASTPASVVLPGGIRASLTGGTNNQNLTGTTVAFRTSTADSAGQDGEYLFVRAGTNGTPKVTWERGSALEGVGT